MTTIRCATEEDFNAVMAVHSPAGRTDNRNAQVHRWIRGGNCFVAVVDRQIVGYTALEYTFYENGLISALLVRPEFRRKGIGSQLMTRVETSCRTPKLFTSTNLSNVPMQGLLTRLGYRLSGVINDLDEGDPELVFFKRVGPPC